MTFDQPNTQKILSKVSRLSLLILSLCLSVSCSLRNKSPETIATDPLPSPSPTVEKIPTPLPLELQPIPETKTTPTPEEKQPETPQTTVEKPLPIPTIPTPESTPPVVAFRPQTADDILKYVYQEKNKLNLCDGTIDDAVSQEVSSVYTLDEKRYLVELLCFMGPYQGSYQYFLYSLTPTGFDLKPLTLDRFEPDETGKMNKTKAQSVGGLPDYNESEKSLIILTKGRGLSDCGSLAEYKLTESDLELVEYRFKEECDGKYIEPEEYPKIYP
jgi:hypothetical protein